MIPAFLHLLFPQQVNVLIHLIFKALVLFDLRFVKAVSASKQFHWDTANGGFFDCDEIWLHSITVVWA